MRFSAIAVAVVLGLGCLVPMVEAARVVRRDTNADGKVDQIVRLDDGGAVQRLEVDGDGDGFFETVQHYRNGELVRLETDGDGDRRRETRFLYEQGVRVRAEMDDDGDGRAERAVDFQGDRRLRDYEDTDGDGRFDRILSYLDPFWPLVEERDGDGDGFFEERSTYLDGILREREVHGADPPYRAESYDARGRLFLVVEGDAQGKRVRSVWTFDPEGRPASCLEDRNGDGRMDLWGRYEAGRLRYLAEDRNGDGRPDAWTEYDSVGKEVRVRRDVDYDGAVDIDRKENGS
ncbi:hypothetical protein SAMN02745206_01479 [Desulfacinum infernum DSM 9756]|uniref:Uncharacterized protein n=1 Tax=Desulfacinum infernum DSM 9756 TaxID=1121391 RepID=A0A1M4ZJ10_9BACT|nr:hypothetical protein [Desulfacinum infernum]SHF18050.1 hypothetical protein SAMN02745206_01479 [Desulfacinum infernum DSM 9756]